MGTNDGDDEGLGCILINLIALIIILITLIIVLIISEGVPEGRPEESSEGGLGVTFGCQPVARPWACRVVTVRLHSIQCHLRGA